LYNQSKTQPEAVKKPNAEVLLEAIEDYVGKVVDYELLSHRYNHHSRQDVEQYELGHSMEKMLIKRESLRKSLNEIIGE